MKTTVCFDVMSHFIRFWSVPLYFAGVLLLFVHSANGQGMRDLIDLTPKPIQPTPSPVPSPQPGRVLFPTLPNGEAIPALTPANPFGRPEEQILLRNNPIIFNSELSRILTQSSPAGGAPQNSPPSDDSTTASKQLLDKIASVFEEATEDEREEHELLFQRRQAEQISDPERRRETLERIARTETAYRNRLARRQAEEVGADLFYVPRLKEQFLKEGWCQLFDGHTDTCWKIQAEGPYGGGKFTFGPNEICSDPYHPGLIYTSVPFGDSNLRFDFCAEKDSEVYLLLKTPPDPADLNSSCYTFVLNSTKSNRPRGILLGRHGLSFAALRSMREMLDNPENEADEVWHSVIVTCEGNDIQFWMDNRSPMTYFDPKPLLSGHIAFLVAKGKARFQNILWQPGRAISIFDAEHEGETPWRMSQGAEFDGNSGNAGFSLAKGAVESKEFYKNFVLQMRYRQGMISGRSSLFVRSLPGQENTGYEISLQNFPKRKDRESVVGVDAGAFRQIKDARYVRAQDQQWTYLTVAAVDRQLQTWVNGVPVCEITDQRKVQENSLVGPFLRPGPIRLSVPPENTLFEFQHLTMSPIPP